jgi:hypothetical protein
MDNFIDVSNHQYSRPEIYLSMLLKRIYLWEIVINKAEQFKSDTSKSKSLIYLIRKGYDLATIVHSLMHVYFAKNIDNLLVQLVDSCDP